MNTALKILMVTSEAVPWAKAGGLADVVPVLAAELEARGHDARIVLPRYYSIDTAPLEDTGIVLPVSLGGTTEEVRVYRALYPGSKVQAYFLDHQGLFGRDGIYAQAGGHDFPDNARRFALLNNAVFPLCHALGWIPDILHAHDWCAAPSLAMLDTREVSRGFGQTAGIFTIHNVGYHGSFDSSEFALLDLDWQEFRMGAFEFYGRLNFMQGGLRHARKITTVSPRYAREITHPDFGFGMDGILRERYRDLEGILNGMDYGEWTPSTDAHLVAPFDSDDLAGKAANKSALQKELGLEVRDDIPLVGIISRMVGQKGFRELAAPGHGCLPGVLRDFPLQMVILGTGEAWCEQELMRLAGEHSNLKVVLAYSNRLSHRIQAASDFFLMPSLYEPCGLTQMYALRYGTLPIVSNTGGLSDTVKDKDAHPRQGTGISFDLPVTPGSIYRALWRAMDLWLDYPDELQAMRQRGMAQRFTWEDSCKAYEDLYRQALAGKPLP